MIAAGERRALDRLVVLQIGERDHAAVASSSPRRSASRSRPRRTRPARSSRSARASAPAPAARASRRPRRSGRSSGRCASIRATRRDSSIPSGFRPARTRSEIPSIASSTAGARFSAHFRLPYLDSAISKPRTVPGTPDDRQPSMLSRVSSPLASRYMLRDAFCGRALAEVDERRTAVGHADQHVAAAAEVAGERMRDRHREADRHRGVHRVAAGLQHRHADVGRDRLHGDHHALPRAQRLTDGVQRNGQDQDQEERQAASHGDSL